MSSGDLIDFQSLLVEAVRAAIKAGDAVLEVYASGFSVDHKEDKSPLTEADKRSHEIIAGQLNGPHAGKLPLLSEEGRAVPFNERKTWGHYWLVDPLDGTKEFVRRNGEFTVNIALIMKDKPVLGVVLVPVRDMLYFALEGRGAFKISGTGRIKNEITYRELEASAKRLPMETQAGSRPFTAIASRSHLSDETGAFIAGLKKEHGEIRIISAGSSLKFCLIAEGSADIYPRFGPTMEWDTAAGQAIVEQAGGAVLRHDTCSPLRYNKSSLLNPWFIVRGP